MSAGTMAVMTTFLRRSSVSLVTVLLAGVLAACGGTAASGAPASSATPATASTARPTPALTEGPPPTVVPVPSSGPATDPPEPTQPPDGGTTDTEWGCDPRRRARRLPGDPRRETR